MTEDTDSTFVVQKRRRRSSLFVERCPSLHNDSSDALANGSNSEASQTISQLQTYITQLKQCKKSWALYEKKLTKSISRSQSDAHVRTSTNHRISEDNYMEYLDQDDRDFMKKMTSLHDSFDDKKIAEIKDKLEVVRMCYENDKTRSATLFENVGRAHRKLVMEKIRELVDEKDDLKWIDSTYYPITDLAQDVLVYNSDPED